MGAKVTKPITDALLFAKLAVNILRDMAAQVKLILSLLVYFVIFACFRMFYMTTPAWARWLVTIYFLFEILKIVGNLTRVQPHVLKAQYNAWMDSVKK